LLNSYFPIFQAASARTGIPVQMLMAQAMQESGGNPNAVGRAGEIGLMQIMPSTAKQPGYGVKPVDVASLSDPETNINFGADYLAGRGKSAGVKDWNSPDQMALALKNYNGGGDPNYVQNVHQHLPKFGGADAAGDMIGGEGNDPFSRAKMAGMPDWYNGSPESYLKTAGNQPSPSAANGMSIMDRLGQWSDNNSDMLLNLGLGLLSGKNDSNAWSNAMSGALAGRQSDRERNTQRQEQSAAETVAKQFPQFADMIRANPQLAKSIVAAQINNTMADKSPEYAYEKMDDGSLVAVNKKDPSDFKVLTKGAGGGKPLQDAADRARIAETLGIAPDSQEFKHFVATGKMPNEDQQRLTATDKKAILEADELVAVNQGAISNLEKALEMSSQAYDGVTAGIRGTVMGNLGDESGQKTQELDNLIKMNAVNSLKAIFGAMPTEGERKILMELQGSVGLPMEVRNDIYRRALQMAKSRLQMNQERADQLRGGTFYAPGGGKSSPATSGQTTNGVPFSIEP
jgi:flagellum-specific peptidoglycan hydrolase FlgJ